MNVLASHVLEVLYKAGVKEAVVCPGGRNAPFVELLASSSTSIRPYWHFEERSAAFFALGRIKATGLPVVVITTSGTAAGELFPATMEAYYSGLPLVLLTADRPRRFRGSGAPQAAEQSGLFRKFAPLAHDLEGDDELDLFELKSSSPIHINVCFEDPNGEPGLAEAGTQAPSPDPCESLKGFLAECSQPLVIVGALEGEERVAVEKFLLKYQAPAYLEGLSGLRERESLSQLRTKLGDALISRANASGYKIDGIIRIGGVPTHRIWRDLEDRCANIPVVSVSRIHFSGLGRSSILCCGDVQAILESQEVVPPQGSKEFLSLDGKLAEELDNKLSREPNSEPGMIRGLSNLIEVDSTVFVGNSLPVREWDLAATYTPRNLNVYASRGLNGIDGQVSTFLGLCKPDVPNWAILGDLTALYDLPAPWINGQIDSSISATIVVINNSGGRIFERMFPQPEFLNVHQIGFAAWAKQWDLDYQLCSNVDEIEPSRPGLRVVELRPDAEATNRFWKAHAEALK